jgi:hypothetical protein
MTFPQTNSDLKLVSPFFDSFTLKLTHSRDTFKQNNFFVKNRPTLPAVEHNSMVEMMHLTCPLTPGTITDDDVKGGIMTSQAVCILTSQCVCNVVTVFCLMTSHFVSTSQTVDHITSMQKDEFEY